jgi:hypothetical protein
MTFSTTPVVCLTLAKWETVSGRFGGYLTVSVVETGNNQPSDGARANHLPGFATVGLPGKRSTNPD